MQRHPDSLSYEKHVDGPHVELKGLSLCFSSMLTGLHPPWATGHRDGTLAHKPGHKWELGHLKFDRINVLCDPMLPMKNMTPGEISPFEWHTKAEEAGASY